MPIILPSSQIDFSGFMLGERSHSLVIYVNWRSQIGISQWLWSHGQQEKVLKRRELIHRTHGICKGILLESVVEYWSESMNKQTYLMNWKKRSPKSHKKWLSELLHPNLVSVLTSQNRKVLIYEASSRDYSMTGPTSV